MSNCQRFKRAAPEYAVNVLNAASWVHDAPLVPYRAQWTATTCALLAATETYLGLGNWVEMYI